MRKESCQASVGSISATSIPVEEGGPLRTRALCYHVKDGQWHYCVLRARAMPLFPKTATYCYSYALCSFV